VTAPAAYARVASVLWRSTSTGPVVLAADWDTPRHLGGVLALVWEALDEPVPCAEVESDVAELVAAAEVPQVQDALDELVALGVVEELAP